MAVSQSVYQQLFLYLRDGATAVCASRRLSRYLANAYAGWQQQQGQVVWETPDVIYWKDWLAHSWERCLEMELAPPGQLLLDDDQSRLIWEQIIQASRPADSLLNISSTARSVRDAWVLLNDYCLTLDDIHSPYNEDVAMFMRWASTYQSQCQQHGWMDRSRLASALTAINSKAGSHDITGSSKIHLVGFDEMTPAQHSFISCLQQNAVAVESWQDDYIETNARHTSLADKQQELLYAARWARTVIEKDSSAQVAILVPDLEQRHEQVSNIFSGILAPTTHAGQAVSSQLPFNISIRQSLAKVPVIRDALLLLELLQKSIPLDRISHILRSPYLKGGDHEYISRCLLDRKMRDRCDARISLDTLVFFAGHDDADCPDLHALARTIKQSFKDQSAELSPYEWARWISKYLEACGWPGERNPDSNEYQAIQAFRSVLDDLSRLQQVVSSMRFRQILQRLRATLKNRSFQPESAQVPIQVMGVLEASGLYFSHLWITGMDDSRWPSPVRPNPFLPLALQRSRQMPHASVERELDYTRRISQRLLASADEVIVSYARNVDDSEQDLSPVFRHITHMATEEISVSDVSLYMHLLNKMDISLDAYDDEHAAKLDVKNISAGGTGIFKDQAACPFRANGLHRLKARPLETPHIGLQPSDRGNILHEILARIWLELEDHAALTSMSAADRKQCVERHCKDVLSAFQKRKPDALGRKLFVMEVQRLSGQIMSWLDIEVERTPFRVVSPEQEHVHCIAGMPIRIRPDRIDQLAEGDLVLIDYKSGSNVEAKHWFGSRPEEPQMPVYALANVEKVRAVAYGVIRAGKQAFDGVAAADNLLPGCDIVGVERRKKYLAEFSGWPDMLDYWQKQMHHLATEIIDGDARVAPKLPTTCRYCQLHSFCRIYQRSEHLSEEETS
jgi:probable DNA repair protein